MPVVHEEEISELLDAIKLLSRFAIVKCTAHKKDGAFVSGVNDAADEAARKAAVKQIHMMPEPTTQTEPNPHEDDESDSPESGGDPEESQGISPDSEEQVTVPSYISGLCATHTRFIFISRHTGNSIRKIDP